MTPPTAAQALAESVLSAATGQVANVQPDGAFIADIARLHADLRKLDKDLKPFPLNASIQTELQQSVLPPIQNIIEAKAPKASLALSLAALHLVADAFPSAFDAWIAAGSGTLQQKDSLTATIKTLTDSISKLLARRPDVEAVMSDLAAMKELRGGPADAVAFHDFHVLQVAFKDVWLHAFDSSLQRAAEDLYTMLVADKVELGEPFSDPPECRDATQLRELIEGLRSVTVTEIPPEVWGAFGTLASSAWVRLSPDQQYLVLQHAKVYGGPNAPGHITLPPVNGQPGPLLPWQQAKEAGEAILNAAKLEPQSARGRLADLIDRIHGMLSEPYAFDVFAKDSYNFGAMITYRQRWEPGPYQAGDLVATLPLAPGESRKFVKKRTTKVSRAVKEIEKSMSSRSSQSSVNTRAEYEIMQRTTTATNFKMTASGSFNVGIGSFTTSTEFGGNQEQLSAATKKGFHEATLKAAEEYRLERSIEITTAASTDLEETESGEVSNPNNELTVTYLFYELQRRFTVREFLHRVRPVIMVAQEVPAPHQIDEAWLLKHHWILARVILDDSLLTALNYISTGFAGDELAVEVKRATWDTQRRLAQAMEAKSREQQIMRDKLRESLITTTLTKDLVPQMPGALKFFTFGVDPSETATDALEANRKAIETRLSYAEGALADAQERAKEAATALQTATREYATALENQYNRRVAIDQLRIHVKQNILYYMQAIWDHEPPDQRFFRLYKIKVACIAPDPDCKPQVSGTAPETARSAAGRSLTSNAMDHLNIVVIDKICSPAGGIGGVQHDLVELADLDNPLGYKGNYMIFPLKKTCFISEYMVSAYIDNHLGLIDPDKSTQFDHDDFETRWNAAAGDATARDGLRKELTDYLTKARRTIDEVIVPTGQLFIEALPGKHPLLEDFKLAHRAQDVRKVMAEVRHAELENLRLAARLAVADQTPAFLSDPEIEKKIVVESGVSTGVITGT